MLNIAKKSQTVVAFGKELASNGAEFDQDLVNTIFAIVTRIFPRARDSHLADIFEREGSPAVKSDGDRERMPFEEEKKGEIGEDDLYDGEKNKKVQKELTKQFPGLAMPNKVVKDDDEIELDLDELDDALKSAPKPPSSPPPQARKSRQRSRSPASSNDSRRRHRSHKSRRSPEDDRRRSRHHHRRHKSRSSSRS